MIFVHVDAAEALGRAVRRDAGLFGSAGKARARYEARYLPGQDLYLRAVRPRESADVVVDNTDPDRLRIVPSRAGAGAEDG